MWNLDKLLKAIALLQKFLPDLIDLFSKTPVTAASCPDCPEELKPHLQALCDFLNKTA